MIADYALERSLRALPDRERSQGAIQIDLKRVPLYYISLDSAAERQANLTRGLALLGLTGEREPGVVHADPRMGGRWPLSRPP